MVLTAGTAPIMQLPEPFDTDIIEGVRVVTQHTQDSDDIDAAVQTFEDAGWPLTNLEVRIGAEDGCGSHAGVHSFEKGHHVVELCTDEPFVLLHELGHVWSDLYLDDERRAEWLELRSLDSWSGAEHHERGTEQAAHIIAFGLLDTWHTPMSIAPNDPESLIESFTWLFGMEPLHMGGRRVRIAAAANTTNTGPGAPATAQIPSALTHTARR